jgi:hypothetical protein
MENALFDTPGPLRLQALRRLTGFERPLEIHLLLFQGIITYRASRRNRRASDECCQRCSRADRHRDVTRRFRVMHARAPLSDMRRHWRVDVKTRQKAHAALTVADDNWARAIILTAIAKNFAPNASLPTPNRIDQRRDVATLLFVIVTRELLRKLTASFWSIFGVNNSQRSRRDEIGFLAP